LKSQNLARDDNAKLPLKMAGANVQGASGFRHLQLVRQRLKATDPTWMVSRFGKNGAPMSNVVNFPSKLSIDSMTAEERASLLDAVLENTERFASAFIALEGEICDLAFMGETTRDLAGDLIKQPDFPRAADLLFSAVQQLANQIKEFTTRYYERLERAEADAADNAVN
jgi:hypothetical protein